MGMLTVHTISVLSFLDSIDTPIHGVCIVRHVYIKRQRTSNTPNYVSNTPNKWSVLYFIFIDTYNIHLQLMTTYLARFLYNLNILDKHKWRGS